MRQYVLVQQDLLCVLTHRLLSVMYSVYTHSVTASVYASKQPACGCNRREPPHVCGRKSHICSARSLIHLARMHTEDSLKRKHLSSGDFQALWQLAFAACL